MLDYQAVFGDPLGFAYDDVPFELPPAVVAAVGASVAGSSRSTARRS
jgi:hypothetical protein